MFISFFIKEVNMKRYNVAVVGATGLVGLEMIKILHERNFPINELVLIASESSEGKKLKFGEEELNVQSYEEGIFSEIDIALFSAGSVVSKKLAPIAAKSGTIVIDNSSAFRMHNDVPLVVPEVNATQIFEHEGIIANPNCSTIQMAIALNPIYRTTKIKRIVVSTYQAVSGSGKAAIEELTNQTMAVLDNEEIVREVYPHQIAFNAIPHIDVFEDNGFSKEEMKLIHETRKIFNDDSIKINATAVRIPVFKGHSESVYIETESKIEVDEIKRILLETPGVKLVDELKTSKYPLAIMTKYYDEVLVGRIRKDLHVKNGISMWIVGDNLRKGAALNAVQIAEKLIEKGLE